MNKESQMNHDIQVNSQQKIIDTLHILQEAGTLQGIDTEQVTVKSVRRGMYVDIKEIYEEEHIYTGDILELI